MNTSLADLLCGALEMFIMAPSLVSLCLQILAEFLFFDYFPIQAKKFS